MMRFDGEPNRKNNEEEEEEEEKRYGSPLPRSQPLERAIGPQCYVDSTF